MIERTGPDGDARLVRVALDSGERLTGAWYPPAQPTRVALLHLHGKGGNFYSSTGASIPEHDDGREVAHLSLNMRCHDLGYTRPDVRMPDAHRGVIAVAGGMWERLADGYRDVEAGIAWLAERGYDRVFIAGHSSGGWYAAQACARSGGAVAGQLLLSPVISNKRHLDVWFSDGGLERAEREARELVAQGEGHRLLATRTWYYAISAASLLERLEEPDDVLETMLAAAPGVPLMLACGTEEPRVPQWRALFDGLATEHKQWLELDGVGHDYGGRERELTDAVLAFARTYAAPSRAERASV